jgi:transmembrane sensor
VTSTPQDVRRSRAARDAAEWISRLEDESLSATDRAEFVAWLRESPLHIAEMLRAKHVNLVLREYPDWDKLDCTDATSSDDTDSILPFAGDSRRTDRFMHTPPSRSLRWRPALLAVASVLFAVVLALFYSIPRGATTVATGAKERREIQLADGSTITLAPDTLIRFKLSPAQRSIELDHGEALFHVAKDPNRPFVVGAANTNVRAVGTVFNVINNADTVVVAVTEGRVAVNPSVRRDGKGQSAGSGLDIMVAANQQVAVSAGGRATAVHSFTAMDGTSSISTQFAVENETVAEIVQRFNSMNKVKIRILDAKLAGLRISGVFNREEPQSFAAFLEAAAGIGYVQQPNDEIDLGAVAEVPGIVPTR